VLAYFLFVGRACPTDYRSDVPGESLKRVLIIEDDQAIRESIAEVLTDQGYAVAAAPDGLEGLREARAQRPNLIMLDLMMPTMNGWQFREAQKQDPSLADIPVIVISAYSDVRGPALDEAARFPKPFDLVTLLLAVEKYAVST
jgi:CheY-like chemotaxis protein